MTTIDRTDTQVGKAGTGSYQQGGSSDAHGHGDRDYPQYPGSGGGGGLHRRITASRGGSIRRKHPCAMPSSIATAKNAGEGQQEADGRKECIALTLPEVWVREAGDSEFASRELEGAKFAKFETFFLWRRDGLQLLCTLRATAQ